MNAYKKSFEANVFHFFDSMLKDIVFALELGIRVLGMFLFCVLIGYRLDAYFHSQPICILVGLIFAFVYVMRLLLGVGRHE